MPSLKQVARSAPAKASSAEQRRHDRHLGIDAGVLRLAVRPTFRGRRGLLVDVSAGGIGLLLAEPLEVNTILALDLRGPDGLATAGRIALVRHCRPHAIPADAPWLPRPAALARFFRSLLRLSAPPAEGSAWLVGCEFSRPLDPGELEQLLGLLGPSPAAADAGRPNAT